MNTLNLTMIKGYGAEMLVGCAPVGGHMAAGVASRRALFARLRGGPEQLRPPWTGNEDDFLEACTRCGKCVAACPTGLIAKGHAGYPIVEFSRASCTFCGACAEVCEPACISRAPGPAWRLRARISQACVEPKGVTCRRCEEACDAAAIRFRPKLGGGATPSIDLELCTGCGACVAPCPVKAIAMNEMAEALS